MFFGEVFFGEAFALRQKNPFSSFSLAFLRVRLRGML
jgi:hypothetical protein